VYKFETSAFSAPVAYQPVSAEICALAGEIMDPIKPGRSRLDRGRSFCHDPRTTRELIIQPDQLQLDPASLLGLIFPEEATRGAPVGALVGAGTAPTCAVAVAETGGGRGR
jgi:hypothetical protein